MMDAIIENLFEQKLFLILFGLFLYYTILWSMAKNKVNTLRDSMLALCDNKAERALVYAEDRYTFVFKNWLNDQKDEILIAALSALLLIEFDDVALEVINRNLDKPMEAGNWIYLCGGFIGDIFYRGIKKLRS